ncbi:MAG: cytochrome c [Alphaproteobacteria bacterium]|nr:cytochrome c [Alphaproteobacteria bacterium]
MSKFVLISVRRTLLVAAFLAGSLGAGLAEESSPSQKGQEIATKLCARCHSVTRDGDSPFAEAPPFRTFSSKWPLESLEEALAEGIVVGHPAMPEFIFGPEDIQNLLSYIASISQ